MNRTRKHQAFTLQDNYDVMELITIISRSKSGIDYIYLYEKGDASDMSNFSFAGEYSLKVFFEKYPLINKEDVDSILIKTNDGCRFFLMENSNYFSFSSNANTKLEDYLDLDKIAIVETKTIR